jgi:hypothetical protein
MSMLIHQFLAAATGPSKLRSDLRRRTQSVRGFFNALDGVTTVGEEVPPSILGGDIHALMSHRLQQQLLNLAQPDREQEIVRTRRSQLLEAGFNLDPNSKPFSSPAMDTGSSYSPPTSPSRLRREVPQFSAATPSKTAAAAEEFNLMPPAVGKAHLAPPQSTSAPLPIDAVLLKTLQQSITVPQLAQGLNQEVSKRQSVSSERTGMSPRTRSLGQSAESLLIKKLQTYWQLSQQEATLKQSAVDAANEGIDTLTKMPPFLSSTPNLTSSQAWPEITGQRASQILGSLVTGQPLSGTAKTVKQTIRTDLPDKVEIRNIFNVEVKSQTEHGDRSIPDLSEKIADILREQAVQHGIDIT